MARKKPTTTRKPKTPDVPREEAVAKLQAAGVPEADHEGVLALAAPLAKSGVSLSQVLELVEQFGPIVVQILRRLLSKEPQQQPSPASPQPPA